MRKNFVLILVCVLVVLCMTACLIACEDNPQNVVPTPLPTPSDGTTENNDTPTTTTPDTSTEDTTHSHQYLKSVNGSTFTMSCSCGDSLKGYRIQFVWAEDGSNAEEGIEVGWIDQNNHEYSATTNSDGYVEALQLLDDSYTLYINEDSLPSFGSTKYWVDSAKFSSQTNGVGLIIPLVSVSSLGDAGSLSVSDSSYDYYSIELNKTYIATVNNANEKIWFSLQNGSFGKYTVDATYSSDVDVTLSRYFGSIYYVNPSSDKAAVAENNKLTYTVIVNDANQNSLFCLSAPNASSYPLSVPFSVTITYVPEITPVTASTFVAPSHFQTESSTYTYYVVNERNENEITEITVNSLAPVSGVEKCQDVEGSVINDLSSQEMETMQLRADGYYYTTDNKLVYVRLDAESEFFYNSPTLTLANYLETSGLKTIYTVKLRDIEYDYITRWDDYFGFIQAYTALANSDGLYPLTEEMFEYLQAIAPKENQTANVLLCTYPRQVSNFTVGSGTESAPYVLDLNGQTFGNYNLSIAEGGKVYLTLNGDMDVSLTFNSNVKAMVSATSTYNGEYVYVNGTKTITFETKDGSAINFILNIKEYNDPYYIEMGQNQYSMEPNTSTEKMFTAPSAGSYEISVSTSAVTVTVTKNGQDPVVLDGTSTFELNEGDSLYFSIESTQTIVINYTLTVETTLEN